MFQAIKAFIDLMLTDKLSLIFGYELLLLIRVGLGDAEVAMCFFAIFAVDRVCIFDYFFAKVAGFHYLS